MGTMGEIDSETTWRRERGREIQRKEDGKREVRIERESWRKRGSFGVQRAVRQVHSL